MAEWTPLFTLAVALLVALLGSGGVVAIRRFRHDREMGISQKEVNEDAADVARLRAIIDAQTESLVQPLRDELADLRERFAKLEGDLRESRQQYWLAISYIRGLLVWIARHMPEDVESTMPTVPSGIAKDV